MDIKEREQAIEEAVSELDRTGHALHALAIRDGKIDEVCPRIGCGRIFLAHLDENVICGCEQKPCYYSMSEMERRGLIISCSECGASGHIAENCPGL